jgi:orotate phosphoribosyltransferase
MQQYKKEFVNDLASTGALFFKYKAGETEERKRWTLTLKDKRSTEYFVNVGGFNTGSAAQRLGSYFGRAALENGLKEGAKGVSLVVATAMYLASEHGLDVPIYYDHKEEGTFIGLSLNTGPGLITLGRELVNGHGKEMEGATIIASPSYESNVLAVATSIMAEEAGVGDLGFAYDRFKAKAHGEGSGEGTKWVGKTPKEGDKVFVVYNQCLTSPIRLTSFIKSIKAAGAEVIGQEGVGYDEKSSIVTGTGLFLLDDVATSMDTKRDTIKLLSPLELAHILVGMDREQVGPVYDGEMPADVGDAGQWKMDHVVLGERGKDAIGGFVEETGIPVSAVLGIRETVDILDKEGIPVKINDEMRPLDEVAKAEFDAYMDLYGSLRNVG